MGASLSPRPAGRGHTSHRRPACPSGPGAGPPRGGHGPGLGVRRTVAPFSRHKSAARQQRIPAPLSAAVTAQMPSGVHEPPSAGASDRFAPSCFGVPDRSRLRRLASTSGRCDLSRLAELWCARSVSDVFRPKRARQRLAARLLSSRRTGRRGDFGDQPNAAGRRSGRNSLPAVLRDGTLNCWRRGRGPSRRVSK